jgi:hypothetical protein
MLPHASGRLIRSLVLRRAGCKRTPGHLHRSRFGKAQLQTDNWSQWQQAAAHRAIFAAAASNATPPNDDPNGASSGDASTDKPGDGADAAQERRRKVWERAAQLHAERQVCPAANDEPFAISARAQ